VIRAPRSSLRPAKIDGFDVPLPRMEFSVPTQPDPQLPKPSREDASPRAQEPAVPVSAQVTVPSPSRLRTSPEEARPTAPIAPLQMPPPAGPLRREPKVTIGQIDVQVINQPQPLAPAPAASARPVESSSFASAEIELFRCRLV
jgi:hypothetical protein